MGRDPERIDVILAELETYWKNNPDLRLAQIIGNIGQENGFGTDPYYMEDSVLLESFEEKNQD